MADSLDGRRSTSRKKYRHVYAWMIARDLGLIHTACLLHGGGSWWRKGGRVRRLAGFSTVRLPLAAEKHVPGHTTAQFTSNVPCFRLVSSGMHLFRSVSTCPMGLAWSNTYICPALFSHVDHRTTQHAPNSPPNAIVARASLCPGYASSHAEHPRSRPDSPGCI